MNILEQIVAQRRKHAATLRGPRAARSRSPHRLRDALRKPDTNIIAEFKRASPSCGAIRSDARITEIIPSYERAGASALSVLTEPHYFRGSIDDLREARALTRLPILQKDFIVAESQIDEAANAGADAVLLIAAVLGDEELRSLRAYAEEIIGIDALVEVHTADEMRRAIECGAKLIGVNNRDLSNFTTSLQTSEQLAHLTPADVTLVTESGISSHEDVARLEQRSYAAFLVGESLMRAEDPAAALRALRGDRTRIKICGVTNVDDAQLCAAAGVDFIGLNFSPESARCISVENAREIISTVRARFIGVFVNQPIEFVNSLPLAGVQLHGEEPPDFVRDVQAPFVIKALRAGPGFAFTKYDCDAILLDAWSDNGRGGTGETFDWSIASRVKSQARRLILAGGLTTANVRSAIESVRPFAVDVCSGVEDAPGRKNPEKLREFVTAVRQ